MDRILKEIKREELIRLTQELVRIPSVRREGLGGNEREASRYVARLLEDMGLEVVVEEVEPGSPNVIAVLQGAEDGPCLMFECHTDVVTEGDASEWKYGPFEGRLSGNRIYGRGACDAKGNLAAAWQAVKAISQSGTLFGPQAIAMVHDAGGAVFLDLKFHDIHNTVARASAEVVRHGVLMFNIHAMGGFEMMQQTVAAVRKMAENFGVRSPLVLAVTVLTSLAESDLAAVGIAAGIKDQVRRLAQLAQSAGVDGVVASPQEIEVVKTAFGSELLVVTPGLRPKAAGADDQKRILSPGEANRQRRRLYCCWPPGY